MTTATTDRRATLWHPGIAGWWIALLFVVGSALFAVGAVPAYLDAVGGRADSGTFFVGWLFFTAAALLVTLTTPRASKAAWWAAVVQSVGTLFFNASTFHALQSNLSASAADRQVW